MISLAEMISDMDAVIAEELSDGQADFLDADGVVQHQGLSVMLERDVEKIDVANGMLDRAVTISVRQSQLPQYDRKGAFRLDPEQWGQLGKIWYLDGIASDDGYWISFYVVP